ncbi:hypothetical protein SNEBB_011012 [Seison nebaliae]|nr:hypothetical protein SNEBB_011012 [Seison nebaliae]
MQFFLVFCLFIVALTKGKHITRWSEWTPTTTCKAVADRPCGVGIQLKIRSCLTKKCEGPASLTFPCELDGVDCRHSKRKSLKMERWVKSKSNNDLNSDYYLQISDMFLHHPDMIDKKKTKKMVLFRKRRRRRRQVLEYPVNPFLNSFVPLAQGGVPLAAPMAAPVMAPLAGAPVAAVSPLGAGYEPYPFAVPQGAALAPFPLVYPAQSRQKRSLIKKRFMYNSSSCSFHIHKLDCLHGHMKQVRKHKMEKNEGVDEEIEIESIDLIKIKSVKIQHIFFREIIFELQSIIANTLAMDNTSSIDCDVKKIYDESLPNHHGNLLNESRCFTGCLNGHVFYMISKALYCGSMLPEELVDRVRRMEERLDQFIQSFIMGRCGETRKCEVKNKSLKEIIINHVLEELIQLMMNNETQHRSSIPSFMWHKFIKEKIADCLQYEITTEYECITKDYGTESIILNNNIIHHNSPNSRQQRSNNSLMNIYNLFRLSITPFGPFNSSCNSITKTMPQHKTYRDVVVANRMIMVYIPVMMLMLYFFYSFQTRHHQRCRE